MKMYLGTLLADAGGDEAVLANLTRRGFLPLPEAPVHDPAAEHAPVWDGGDWVVTPKTPETLAAELAAHRESLAVSPRQLRLELLSQGLLAPVEAALAGMEGDAGLAARVEWEFATECRRSHALVDGLALMLDIAPETLDAIWEGAAAR